MNNTIKKYLSEIGKKGGSRTTEAKKRAAREREQKKRDKKDEISLV